MTCEQMLDEAVRRSFSRVTLERVLREPETAEERTFRSVVVYGIRCEFRRILKETR